MAEYIVSARKYRPMSFDSVVGQSSLTTTLKNAVSNGKLAHAYLFCGPRGVGKTTCARIFAKVINCLSPTASGDACGECESCKSFNEGRSLNIFELDAASNNGVEHIKALMEQTHIPPQVGKYKVFIIDEVHMLSASAFNAFLKTLEEPPAHVIFILATTEKHKILPTIISRCQIYDFERMTVQNTIAHLKHVADNEGIKYEEEALAVIAEKADGGMRDALSIFDQVASFCQGDITYAKTIEDLNVLDADNYFKIVDLALDNKVSEIMVIANNILSNGFDAQRMINGLASHMRNVLMAIDMQTTKLIETSDRQRLQYAEQAKRCTPKFLYAALKLLNECDVNYRVSSNKRLLAELTLIQVAQITQEDSDAPGVGRRPCKRLKSLFKKIIASAQSAVASQVATTAQNTNGNTANTVSPSTSQATSASTASSQNSGAASSQSSSAIANNNASATSNNASANNSAVVAANAPDAAIPKKRPNIKAGSLGSSFQTILHGTAKKQENVVQESSSVKENESFDEGDLSREWLAMCNRMMLVQAYNALGKRMMNVHLAITSFPNIELICENTVLLTDVNAILPRIQLTLAQRLHNGNIKVTTRLAEQKEMVRRLSPIEFATKLAEVNPSFAMMQKELKLEVEL